MTPFDRIYVANHESMVGAAIARHLGGRCQLITRTHRELDLGNLAAVQAMLTLEKPDQIYLPMPAAAGLPGSTTGGPLLARLLAITHVVAAAFQARVPRLLFIGSADIYPLMAEPPLREEALMTGPLDPHTETLAAAQIATIKLCDQLSRQHGGTLGIDYRCLVTALPFGPGDDYLSDGVPGIPRLIRQMHEARERAAPIVRVLVRPGDVHEYLHASDIANAARFLMELGHADYRRQTPPGVGHVNAGYGHSCSTRALAATIAQIVGYRGIIDCDPPGAHPPPHRLLDSHRMRRWGWRPALAMEDALALTYFDYRTQHLRTPAAHPGA